MEPVYSKVRAVGKGAFGTVWLVRAERSGERLILKEVPLKGLPPHERRATKNEVDVLRRLRHSNIVEYRDSYVDNASDKLCILMEFCSGGDLGGLISQRRRARKRFTGDEVMSIMTGLVRALAYWCGSITVQIDSLCLVERRLTRPCRLAVTTTSSYFIGISSHRTSF